MKFRGLLDVPPFGEHVFQASPFFYVNCSKAEGVSELYTCFQTKTFSGVFYFRGYSSISTVEFKWTRCTWNCFLGRDPDEL